MTLPSLSRDWPPEDLRPEPPAPLPDPAEPLSWVRTFLAGLERRRAETQVFDDSYEGIQPLNFDEEFRAAFQVANPISREAPDAATRFPFAVLLEEAS